MAYAIPTVAAAVNGGSNPTARQPFNVALTMTSTGTVGVKLRRVVSSQISGPGAVFGNADLSNRTSAEDSGGSNALRTYPKGQPYAGANQPADAGLIANAGSSATTVANVPMLCKKTGDYVVKFILYVTRDDTGDEVQVVCADTSFTVS